MHTMSGTNLEVHPDMSPEDVLAHYGVPGMQWGKRKATGAEIRDSRSRVQLEKSSLKAQKGAIKTAKKMGNKDLVEAERKAYGDKKADFLNNPDRATASRMTKGEKVMVGLFAPYGIPAIVLTSARANSIAKKQAAGKYGTSKIKVPPTASAVTKKVMKDHNEMSNRQFVSKYSTSKKTYSKRVAKHGDPYAQLQSTKVGKRLVEKQLG